MILKHIHICVCYYIFITHIPEVFIYPRFLSLAIKLVEELITGIFLATNDAFLGTTSSSSVYTIIKYI